MEGGYKDRMSRTIENRVVEMQFKNQQFETAVNKSIASLAQLNDSINLLGGTKALKSLDTSVKNLDFSNIKIKDMFKIREKV